MPDQFREMWENRERYQMSPPRYAEVASIPSIQRLFESMGRSWKTSRNWINYVDVGCGDCKGTLSFSKFLEKTTGNVVKTTGIDASEKCEMSCKSKGLDFTRLDLGSERIPLEDCQVITLFETIEHIFDTDFLVESIRRSMSKDSLFLVTTLNVVCWKNRLLVPLGIQPMNTEVSTRKLSYGYRSKSLKQYVDVWKPAGHIRPFTLYSLSDLLDDNGFRIINSYGLENWRIFKFLESIAKNMCTGMLLVARPV